MKVFVLLILLFSAFAEANNVYSSDKMVIVAGTIRQDAYDPAKWCWINDSEHTPVGVNPDLCHTASRGRIVINYGIKYKKVITFIVNADETYSSELNMVVGVSAGLALSILQLTSHGVKIYPSNDLGYRKGNIWIYGVMEKY